MQEDSRSPEFPKVRKKREREANSVKNIKYFFVIRFFLFLFYTFLLLIPSAKRFLYYEYISDYFFKQKLVISENGLFEKMLRHFRIFAIFFISFYLSFIDPLDVKNCYTK